MTDIGIAFLKLVLCAALDLVFTIFFGAVVDSGPDLCPRRLMDFDVSNFEYQIFVVVFYRQAQWKKNHKKFKKRQVQIDELPKTLV